MIWRLQGGTKNDETMTSAGIAGDRQVKTKSSDSCSEVRGFDEVKFSDVCSIFIKAIEKVRHKDGRHGNNNEANA